LDKLLWVYAFQGLSVLVIAQEVNTCFYLQSSTHVCLCFLLFFDGILDRL